MTKLLKLGSLTLLFLLVGLFVAAAKRAGHSPASQSTNTRWVPYSAHYTERVSTRDASGTQTEKQTLTEEVRAEDGGLLTVVKADGRAMSGKLWQSSGEMFSLDYPGKRAVSTGQSPRRHPFAPPDKPLGTKTVAGVSCVIYPLHMHDANGNGTICVNMNDDIQADVEVHTDFKDGSHQDYVKELTWIDLTSPVNPTAIKVPDGFTTLLPSPGQH